MTSGRLWVLWALVVGLLLASLAFAGARLAWHQTGHTDVMPRAVAAPPSGDGPPPQRDVSAIVALKPFGQVATAPPVTERTATLNLVLRGVLVDPDPGQSRAYIRADGATSVFRIGEMVQGAELVAINTDTVTLKMGDDLQIIGFNGAVGAQDEPATPEVAPSDTATDPFARLAAAIVPGQGSIDLRDAPPPETVDEYIDFWRDKITANPQAAMDSVGIELVDNGYRIKADPDIGVTLAGLRAGDVITRLNGQTVGDLNRDRELYDEVAAAGIARLEVVRDGQSVLLTFPLR